MSDLYNAASALTVLLGAVLCIVIVSKYSDTIIQAFQGFFTWADSNAVLILLLLFMVSLFTTALAGVGAI